MQWRAMLEADMAAVLALADLVHPELPESAEVLAEKRSLWPRGCRVLTGPEGGLQGYVFSHPIAAGQPPALNALMGTLPQAPDQYYLHDLVLHPGLRGGGYARSVITALLQEAADFRSAALISVYGTGGFWQRFGFTESDSISPGKLSAYGSDAVWMTRPLP